MGNGQTGTAAPGDSARVGSELQDLPVVVVPGIMGTRLVSHGASGSAPQLIWNPAGMGLGSPTPSDAHFRTSDLTTLTSMNTRLVQDQGYFRHANRPTVQRTLRSAGIFTGSFNPETSSVGDFVPNEAFGTAYGLIVFYQPLLRGIQALDLSALGYRTRVVCAGYDWRQDNAQSAQTLARTVNRAKRHFNADRVILVAHSMGGLVARHFSKSHPNDVRMLILIGSPSIGAPDVYRLLKSHADQKERVMLFGLMAAESEDMAKQGRAVARRMPAAYQLLPNNVYGHARPDWLRFTESRTGQTPGSTSRNASDAFSNCQDAYKLYNDIYTGITDGALGEPHSNDWGRSQTSRNMASRHVATAKRFHDRMSSNGRCWIPPNTHILYGATRETTDGGRLANRTPISNSHGTWFLDSDSQPPTLTPHQGNNGDESVTAISGFPENSRLSRPVQSQHIFNGASHAELPGESGVVTRVCELIEGEMTS